MQSLTKEAETIRDAKRFLMAMKELGATTITMSADGTWVNGKDLIIARSCPVLSLGVSKIKAIIDGREVKMEPYDPGLNGKGQDIRITIKGEWQLKSNGHEAQRIN